MASVEQTRAGGALPEEEPNYRDIFNATSDGLFIHDETGKILLVNERTCAMFGFSDQEFRQLTIADISLNQPPFTQAEAIQHFGHALEKGSCKFAWRSKRKNGELFWSEVALRSCTIAGKQRIIASVRDIDDSKRAGDALRASESKLSKIFHSSSNGMALTEFDSGRIVDVNTTWSNATGIPHGAMVGKTALELGIWADPADREFFVAELAKTGRFRDYEVTFLLKSKRVPHLISAEVLELGGQRYVLWEFRDITERKRAVDALHKAHEQLVDIIESLPDPTFVIDENKKVIAWNHAIEIMSGVSKADMLGQGNYAYAVPLYGRRRPILIDFLDAPEGKWDPQYQRLRDGSDKVYGEWFLPTAYEGKGAHVWAVAAPLYRSDGTRWGAIEVMRDVSDRVETMERLRESERKSRAAFDLSFGFIGLLTPEGTVLDANRSALEFSGAQLAEILGQPFWETPWCKHSPAMQERMRAAVRAAAGGEMVQFEAALRFADDSIHTVDFTLKPVMDEAGKVALLIPEGRDITDYKRTEHALRESEEKFRTLFENAGDAIFLMQEDLFIDCNARALETFGCQTRDQIVGHSPYELSPPFQPNGRESGEFAIEKIAAAMNGQPQLFEWMHTKLDGTPFPAEVSLNVVKLGATVLLQAVVHDITERKRAEAEQARLEDQLRQAQKMESIGRLAGGVAHDFNNHLTVIISHCRMILAQLDPQDPLAERIRQVLRAGDQSAQLTQQLLAFSRKQILQLKIFCPNEVVTDTVHMLDRIIGEDITLVAVLDPALGAIQADPGQISQVLMNLAINARDAMPNGGAITIETANVDLHEDYVERHSEIRPGAYVLITVSDNGTGMDKATLDRIFEPFFTTKSAGMGTGLGLATVYGIVQQSGGSIWAYSEPGQGTTFKIHFPRVNAQAEAASGPAVTLEVVGGDETILVVEDHEDLRLLTVSILRGFGYHILCAANGAEALEEAGSYAGPIHLMITDVVMPGMTGRELAQQLAQIRPEMKVLFTSGYTSNVIVHQGVLDPGVSYLSKPFTPTLLAQKVRSILSLAKRADGKPQ